MLQPKPKALSHNETLYGAFIVGEISRKLKGSEPQPSQAGNGFTFTVPPTCLSTDVDAVLGNLPPLKWLNYLITQRPLEKDTSLQGNDVWVLELRQLTSDQAILQKYRFTLTAGAQPFSMTAAITVL